MNHMFHTQKAILNMSTLPYLINDSIQVWYMRVCHMQHMTHQTHHIQHNAKKKIMHVSWADKHTQTKRVI